jgi:hypothetical protein
MTYLQVLLTIWAILSAGTFLFAFGTICIGLSTPEGKARFEQQKLSYHTTLAVLVVTSILFPIAWRFTYLAIKEQQ